MKEKIITAIDLGTTKFFGLVGLVRESEIEVIGNEVIKTEEGWIKGGRVADMEGVASGLIDLIDALKKQSGEKIDWVTVGVGGRHIVGKIYSKKIDILPKGRTINENDIQLMIREIKNLASLENVNKREIIHLVPQEYIIDEDNVIIGKPPIGMHGNTLEMKAHVLTGEINPLNDIYECAKMAGLKVEKVFPYSWAVAESVLNEEEKKTGCVIIDIGKSSTDFAFFYEGKIILTESLKVGSMHIDSDLSIKFHVSLDFAEELKTYAWCDYKRLIEEKKEEIKTVEIKNPYGKSLGKVSIEEISKVVYLRVREIFEDLIMKDRLLKTGLFPLKTSEIVISGGGAKLKGIVKLAEDIFQLPARIGLPQRLLNLEKDYQKPEFAAGIGLLLLASKGEIEKEETLLDKIKKFFTRWFY